MENDSLNLLGENRVRQFLSLARVARLATSDRAAVPHTIPICFWFDGEIHFYFVIDEKPKRLTSTALKRMRNIAENPQLALIVDHYEEQWAYLPYVLLHAAAHVVEDPQEHL